MDLFESFVDFFYNIESKYFSTFKALSLRPIKFIEDYIKGKRRKYYIPIKYLLFNAGLNLFIFKFFKLDNIDSEPKDVDETLGILIKSDEIYNNLIDDYGQFFLIAVIPLFVISSFVVNRKSKYNASERATAIMYLYGHLILIQTALNLFIGIFPDLVDIRSTMIRVLLILTILLINYKFFKENILNTIWKSAFTLIIIFSGMISIFYFIKLFLDYKYN